MALPLMPVITEPGAMPERIAKVPEPGASRLAERVTVLPLIAAMVAPVGMPVRAVSVPVVASGGVGALAHLVDGVRVGHASAVLAASIFHFGDFSIAEAKAYMADHGIPVRLDA